MHLRIEFQVRCNKVEELVKLLIEKKINYSWIFKDEINKQKRKSEDKYDNKTS